MPAPTSTSCPSWASPRPSCPSASASPGCCAACLAEQRTVRSDRPPADEDLVSPESEQSRADGSTRGSNELLEPVVPILLSAVAVVACVTVDAGPVALALSLAPTLLGL